MSKLNLNLFILISITFIILLISVFNIKNFRIDASSDTLVAQDDEDFIYFNTYSELFNSKNFLLLAVENRDKIDLNFIKNFKNISAKILELEQVSSIFSFIDAPILLSNNTSLNNLSSDSIDTLNNNPKLEIRKVIDEFIKNPVYLNQIINEEGSVFSLVIYLKDNSKLTKAKQKYDNGIISKKE